MALFQPQSKPSSKPAGSSAKSSKSEKKKIQVTEERSDESFVNEILTILNSKTQANEAQGLWVYRAGNGQSTPRFFITGENTYIKETIFLALRSLDNIILKSKSAESDLGSFDTELTLGPVIFRLSKVDADQVSIVILNNELMTIYAALFGTKRLENKEVIATLMYSFFDINKATAKAGGPLKESALHSDILFFYYDSVVQPGLIRMVALPTRLIKLPDANEYGKPEITLNYCFPSYEDVKEWNKGIDQALQGYIKQHAKILQVQAGNFMCMSGESFGKSKVMLLFNPVKQEAHKLSAQMQKDGFIPAREMIHDEPGGRYISFFYFVQIYEKLVLMKCVPNYQRVLSDKHYQQQAAFDAEEQKKIDHAEREDLIKHVRHAASEKNVPFTQFKKYVDELVHKDAKALDKKGSKAKKTILHVAVEAAAQAPTDENQLAKVRYLVRDKKADKTIQDGKKRTPWALANGIKSDFKQLLELVAVETPAAADTATATNRSGLAATPASAAQ